MKLDEALAPLTESWDEPNGVFYRLRQGEFLEEDGDKFLELLRKIDLGDSDLIPRELVRLLWFLPQFTEWQVKRVAEKDPSRESAVRAFENEIWTVIADLFGMP